ncbi:MAG: tetratricopeptide repeat protein, partial [Pseudomonadota bacterium]
MLIKTFCAFIACAACGASAFAAPVAVSARQADGFARILFEWNAPVGVAARVENGVLVARFEERIDGDVSAIQDGAPAYVAAARLDPDGRTVRLALRGEVRLHQSQSFNLVALDLLPPRYRGEPDDIVSPEEQAERAFVARAAAIAPRLKPSAGDVAMQGLLLPLRVDVSYENGISRTTFGWTEPMGYDVSKVEEGVEIVFDAPASADLTRLRVDPPPFIAGAEQAVENGRLAVRIALTEGAGVRHFREGPAVILDVLETEAFDTGRFEPQPLPATPLPPSRLPEPQVEITAVPEEIETLTEDAAPSRPQTAPLQPASAPPVAAPKTVSGNSADASEAVIAGEGVSVDFQRIEDNLRVSFSATSERPAAIFRRGDYLWAIFKGAAAADLSDYSSEYRTYVKSVEQLPGSSATVLRLQLARFALISASAANGRWAVTIGENIAIPADPISVARDARAAAVPKVRLGLKGATDIIWVRDPDIGDDLAVALAPGPSQAVMASRNFVEFIVHATAHGALVQPLTDDLAMEKDAEGVTVFGLAALSLNDDIPAALIAGRGAVAASPAFVDFTNWRSVEGSDFTDMEQRLNAIVAERMLDVANAGQSPEASETLIQFQRDEREAQQYGAVLSLIRSLYAQAKFYIAHELSAEAIAALDLIAERDATQTTQAEYLALRGVADVMMGRYEDAQKAFADPVFSDDRHAQLWRGLAYHGARQWARARHDLQDGIEIAPLYPATWRSRFHLALADAHVKVGDVGAGELETALLTMSELTDAQSAKKRLLDADMLRIAGRIDEALELYAEVEKSMEEPYASWAVYRQTMMSRRAGRIDADEAMRRLAAQQYRWRGDDLELRILHELARQYAEKGAFRQALNAMRDIVESFPDSEVAAEVEKDMNGIFSNLYLDGQAEAMDPVPALALFYENIDLIPSGDGGDIMITRLTDRLISFDLLDQAAELLKHQADNRLQGVPRARA